MNLPLLITEQLGGTERDVGELRDPPIFEMPLMIWFGRLAARGHQDAVMRFGVLIGICYFMALTLASSPTHVYLGQILNAASVAVTTSVAIPFFQDLLPGQADVATAVYSNSFNAGSLLGYLSFGLLVDKLGHHGLISVCAALSTLTLVIVLLAPRRVARA
jgi:MFS transporter, SET family, sugar efflux transporter